MSHHAPDSDASPATPERGTPFEVLRVFTKLGLTSFGGPIAHLSYMKAEIVDRRRWISDDAYADLVALCQFLPGPASSQVGMALGIERAGWLGGIAAWIGFTAPSALALALFAMGVVTFAGDGTEAWIHGLKVVAVPIVALAIAGMARTLCPDKARATIAVISALFMLAWQSAIAQLLTIAVSGVAGWVVYRAQVAPPASGAEPSGRLSPRQGVASWLAFVIILFGVPALSRVLQHPALEVFAHFYRVGALVFGGGHVVLPLLEQDVVGLGWTTSDRFLAGYGAAQAVPGPLFSFAAYLGFVLDGSITGWLGAALALVAIFLPSYFLVSGALPFWARLRSSTVAQSVLRGTNAGVVGLLTAAFYDPVWTVAVESAADFGVALGGFLALSVWKTPPWLVVIASALAMAAIRMSELG